MQTPEAGSNEHRSSGTWGDKASKRGGTEGARVEAEIALEAGALKTTPSDLRVPGDNASLGQSWCKTCGRAVKRETGSAGKGH